MPEHTFAETIEVLWNYHKQGIDVQSTALNLLKDGYYLHANVCVASVYHWFHFFNENSYHSSFPQNCVTPEKRLAFLCTLLDGNRFWELKHFADALKVDISTVRDDICNLGYVRGSYGWTERIITSQ